MQVRKMKNTIQTGFTLIELIIVIVIIGILAAVAIPNLSGTTASAYEAKQDAALGALKSAWAIAYAANTVGGVSTAPTAAQIAAQMTDPTCVGASTTTITCTGITKSDGTGNAVFTVVLNSSNVVAKPSDISITTR